jgi:hypothetical protein
MFNNPKKPRVVPPKEKPTQPGRNIPDYPEKEKEQPSIPDPDIPEIKPTKQNCHDKES